MIPLHTSGDETSDSLPGADSERNKIPPSPAGWSYARRCGKLEPHLPDYRSDSIDKSLLGSLGRPVDPIPFLQDAEEPAHVFDYFAPIFPSELSSGAFLPDRYRLINEIAFSVG
jgi:hypothetical protein